MLIKLRFFLLLLFFFYHFYLNSNQCIMKNVPNIQSSDNRKEIITYIIIKKKTFFD